MFRYCIAHEPEYKRIFFTIRYLFVMFRFNNGTFIPSVLITEQLYYPVL